MARENGPCVVAITAPIRDEAGKDMLKALDEVREAVVAGDVIDVTIVMSIRPAREGQLPGYRLRVGGVVDVPRIVTNLEITKVHLLRPLMGEV
jgi:hypothetical protein